MNLRFYVLCTAALFALGVTTSLALGIPFLTESNITATIHGATYASDTFEPLNYTVIYINSNPPQSLVAKNGTYSFELGPGDYVITARYYQNNTLIYSKQSTLKIEEEGNYVFDLLLYPVSESQATGVIEDNINNFNIVNPRDKTKTGSSTISYLGIAFVIFLLLGGGYKLSRMHKKKKYNRSQVGKLRTSGFLAKTLGKGIDSEVRSEGKVGIVGEAICIKEPIIESSSEIEMAALKKSPLSTDLRETLDVIRGHRGRISQKDLRKKLEYSEVKVSLLLSDLEKRGLIKKLKRGRENIVILVDNE